MQEMTLLGFLLSNLKFKTNSISHSTATATAPGLSSRVFIADLALFKLFYRCQFHLMHFPWAPSARFYVLVAHTWIAFHSMDMMKRAKEFTAWNYCSIWATLIVEFLSTDNFYCRHWLMVRWERLCFHLVHNYFVVIPLYNLFLTDSFCFLLGNPLMSN